MDDMFDAVVELDNGPHFEFSAGTFDVRLYLAFLHEGVFTMDSGQFVFLVRDKAADNSLAAVAEPEAQVEIGEQHYQHALLKLRTLVEPVIIQSREGLVAIGPNDFSNGLTTQE